MELFRKYYDSGKLLELQETQPNWGVTVQTVGHNIHQAHTAYPDHKHPNPYYFDVKNGRVLNEFQLVYISNGTGTFEAKGTPEINVEAGTIFLLYPGIWHRFRPSVETGWEEFWVGFQGQYADYIMQQDCFKASLPLLHIGHNTELLTLFIQLIETIKYEVTGYFQLSSCLIMQLLGIVYASAIMTDGPRRFKNKIIHSARFKMHENLNHNLDIEELAKELNVGYSWFRKAFTELMGSPPGQYYLGIKVEKACKLLKETDLTLAEIASLLGFESEFYFSRIFKKKIGLPPRKYRLVNC